MVNNDARILSNRNIFTGCRPITLKKRRIIVKLMKRYFLFALFLTGIILSCHPEEPIGGTGNGTNTNIGGTNITVFNVTNTIANNPISATNYLLASTLFTITNYEGIRERLLITNFSGVFTNSLTNRFVFTNFYAITNTRLSNQYTPTNYDTLTTLNSGNFSSYSIDLEPYGYKIIFLSNHTGTVDSSTGWWKDAVIYQVFVRSFKDSNGDGKGDLDGLTSKLDYIAELGCDAIWTLPIFESPSIHGYDITDYYAIESDYGTMTDFNEYVTAAHNTGLKVILDLVLNHSSDQHAWFQNSRSGTGATYRDWYVWTNTTLTALDGDNWQLPWGGGSASSVWHSYGGDYYYGAFWSGMPDLNLRNQAVRSEFTNVAKYWLDRGADAYRLDAVRYGVEDGGFPEQADTPENIAWWTELETAVRSFKSTAMMVGEAWTDPDSKITNYWNGGNGLDQVFSFYYFYKMKDSLVNEDKSYINEYLTHHAGLDTPWHFFGPFMDNHDEPDGNNRLFDTVEQNVAKLKLAAVMTMTLPGTPYIYFGTEIGMAKHTSVGGDTAKRTPMHWNDTGNAGFTTGSPWVSIADHSDPYNVEDQIDDPSSIFTHFKKLISLRHYYQTLSRADVTVVDNDQTEVVSYIRPGSDGTILVVMNLSDSSTTASLDFSGSGINSGGTYPMLVIDQLSTNQSADTNESPDFTSTYPSMYLRGVFNSWGTTEMNLVTNYVWSIDVNMSHATNTFKFDANGDWSQNWGDDAPADGVGDLGGDNITVGVSGDVTIRFNDSTLEYTIN